MVRPIVGSIRKGAGDITKRGSKGNKKECHYIHKYNQKA